MTLACFWIAAGLIVYAYLLFPLLILLRGLVIHRRVQKSSITPNISVLIAAHNEAESIGEKLENMLAADYPAEQLEIIVASDGSTDETNRIAAQFVERGIRLLALPRAGKAAALNAAVPEASGEILVFTDANSMFASDALRRLAQPFADATVGGVAGDQRYQKDQSGGVSDSGERTYWNFDRWMKWLQSRAGNTISATGAIYAIRQNLFSPIPEGVTDDFLCSTRVIAQGKRLVFEPTAAAYEPVAKSSGVEFGRKVRVMTRGLRGVWHMRRLLNPFRFGFYSVQLFSHKVLRRLVAFPLLALLPFSLLLWRQGGLYQVALIGQIAIYATALAGWLLRNKRFVGKRLFALPLYLCLVNAAAVVATWRLVRGERVVLWTPQRRASSPEPTAASLNG